MDLVNNLDMQAELHFVLEGGDHSDRGMAGGTGLGTLIGDVPGDARRVEVLGSDALPVPLQITIELNGDEPIDQLTGLINAGRVAAPGALDGLDQRLNDLVKEQAIQSFRDLLALGRTAVRKMKLTRGGTTIRMTLDHVEWLENLPQLFFVSMAAIIMAAGA